MLVVVGDKNKRVAVTLRKAPAAGETAPAERATPETAVAPMATPGEATPENKAPESAAEPGKSTFPYRTVGLVVGAAGVVGLGVGTVFGVEAIVKQNDARCPSNNCGPGATPTRCAPRSPTATCRPASSSWVECSPRPGSRRGCSRRLRTLPTPRG